MASAELVTATASERTLRPGTPAGPFTIDYFRHHHLLNFRLWALLVNRTRLHFLKCTITRCTTMLAMRLDLPRAIHTSFAAAYGTLREITPFSEFAINRISEDLRLFVLVAGGAGVTALSLLQSTVTSLSTW
jgi:hypothetical protein